VRVQVNSVEAGWNQSTKVAGGMPHEQHQSGHRIPHLQVFGIVTALTVAIDATAHEIQWRSGRVVRYQYLIAAVLTAMVLNPTKSKLGSAGGARW
jgi:hypothetical protein